MTIIIRFLVILPFILLFPLNAAATVLTADTTWSGTVTVSEDLLVPRGVTLRILAGTTVRVSASESTKTDPEYLSPLTEITVRGRLVVEGTAASPVVFEASSGKGGEWAGIIIDGGRAHVAGCRIDHADTAFHALAGEVEVTGCTISGNRYGVIAQGQKTTMTIHKSVVSGNDYGLFTLDGGRITDSASMVISNRKKDRHDAPVARRLPEPKQAVPPVREVSRRYMDQVLAGETVWRGRVVVDGILRVPEGSRLVILPGTIVEFTRRDSNGDDIGENGILIQGRIVAKGTPEEPIFFRSAEKSRRAGDWDGINIMNSDETQNLVEYCRFEDAYRALHFHFSNVAVNHADIRNCYRAIQFQESLVDVRDSIVADNRSGIQGRDSSVTLTGNTISGNYVGGNFFRTTLVARRNRILGNLKEGLRVRERAATIEGNLFDGNRFGLLAADTFYGDYTGNAFSHNMEIGLSLRNVDNVAVERNYVGSNGINGINLQDAGGIVRGNLIADNLERGLGVLSFSGTITENAFVANGLYAIDLEGAGNVSAPGNWWGGAEPASVVFDGNRMTGRGKVDTSSSASAPPKFVWPLQEMVVNTTWRGSVVVAAPVSVFPGATLTVHPGTRVEFTKGTGLAVRGKLLAAGEKGKEIVFTSAGAKEPAAWDEIILEHATGSVVSHCIIEYGTWGLHSHFTDLSVFACRFRNNEGGLRFRSGPMKIIGNVFEGNGIGIRSYMGNALIEKNVLTGNVTGLFVREKGSGLTVRRNNIFVNSGYNVRSGDFNDEDVNARENWWGVSDPAETIFDGRNEPGIGKILYEPALKEPVRDAGVAQ